MHGTTHSAGAAMRLTRLTALAGLLAILLAAGVRAEDNPLDPKKTTPERIDLFDQISGPDKVELLRKIYQPEDKSDITRYKIPDFLCKVLKNENESPLVREEALKGMETLIKKIDTNLRTQFLPALNDVLSGNSSTLVQEYVLLSSPAMVDPTGPGPSKLVLDKIVSIAENEKLDKDNELRLRCQAVLAMGRIGNADHLEKLFKLMTTPRKEVVASSVEAVKEYLRSGKIAGLELKPQQLATLKALLAAKETSYEGRAAILRVLGVNAKNFRKTHTNTQIAPGSLEGMQEIKRILTSEASPPYFLVGACIEALGMFAQPDSVSLISQIINLPYMKTGEGPPYRVSAVDVLDQVINANIGDGKAANKVVEDAAAVLVALLNDTQEELAVRRAAAYYLGDMRFPCYHREVFFNALFVNAYAQPGAAGHAIDPALATVCKKSMELLAERTFPDDWGFNEFADWWKRAGQAALTKVGG